MHEMPGFQSDDNRQTPFLVCTLGMVPVYTQTHFTAFFISDSLVTSHRISAK